MINIPASKSTPQIVFTEEKKIFSISGESYPENAMLFFEPVFKWLEEELLKYEEMAFHVNISYMNSSSTKCMLDILDLLCEAAKRGCRVSIVWYYEEGNERALDLAEEFKEDVNIPFEIVAIKS